MPIKRGYMVCRCCEQVATVYEAEGKRSGELYVVCPECGTDQSNKPTRQQFIRDHMAITREEIERGVEVAPIIEPALDTVSEPVLIDNESGFSWGKVLGVVGVVGLCLLGVKR
ncbi:hypothetical protein C5F63_06010 [Photobacterium damselae subsp. damselae]|uniref:hypothetical protein n=1 Tax=Photobacterium damselae TaxID=38293 RepID=UPI000D06C8C6|nr:hypothetical protein [Photobacterium damselae]PSB89062.1 hypothetical protein C5F63_06010 [Photobacterium damselae subsp. damselae]